MADWAPCYHWFHVAKGGDASALESRLADHARRSRQADRWAARIGHPGGRLVQVQTAVPWGHLVLGADVEVCPAYDFLGGPGSATFSAGFNYLFCAGDDRVDLDEVARLLGAGARAWRHVGRSVLALDRPIALTHAAREVHLRSTLGDSTSLARLAEALTLGAERALVARQRRMILGLRTAEHGCIHLGHVDADVKSPRHGVFRFQVTGEHNPLTRVRDVGPSIWALTDDTPATRLPDEGWPFAGDRTR